MTQYFVIVRWLSDWKGMLNKKDQERHHLWNTQLRLNGGEILLLPHQQVQHGQHQADLLPHPHLRAVLVHDVTLTPCRAVARAWLVMMLLSNWYFVIVPADDVDDVFKATKHPFATIVIKHTKKFIYCFALLNYYTVNIIVWEVIILNSKIAKLSLAPAPAPTLISNNPAPPLKFKLFLIPTYGFLI